MPEGSPDRNNRPSSNQPQGPFNRMSRGVLGWVVFVGFALMLLFLLMNNPNQQAKMRIDEFWKSLQDGDIANVILLDNAIQGKFTDAAAKSRGLPEFEVQYPPGAVEHKLIDKIMLANPDVEIESKESNPILFNFLIALVPWILIIAFMWFFVFRQIRGAGGGAGMLGNFGRSRHRVTSKEHTNVTFDEVAGIEEAKEEVTEIIEFLKNPKRFQRLGGRIPRGILLVGEPGCGKTLLAKAIAGEADVPFFSISGSDFVEMFVGVGASRVRDLFKQAKDNSPCIIFLDEIDAVGRRRGASYGGGGHDEREQTLNAILVEMDGFETSDQVIVVAATNRVDVLDPALIRPGRFDRQVYVSLPDVKGRMEILKVHAKKIKLGPAVDLTRLARGTPMFSGADLEAIINEAALLATMSNKDYVEMDDLEESRDKVRWGRSKKSRVIDEEDRKITAYHEAGHAMVQALLKDADPLHKVSIIPRGQMGGATFSLPERDRMVYPKAYLTALLKVTFGGRIAEELFCGDISSGASQDIRQATDIARKMVVEWGMDEKVGFVFYGESEGRPGMFEMPSASRDYSDKTAELIDQEVKAIVDQAYKDTRELILANRDKLEDVAQSLLKFETLDGEEVHAIMRGEKLEKPSITDILDADHMAPPSPPTEESKSEPDSDLPGFGAMPQPG